MSSVCLWSVCTRPLWAVCQWLLSAFYSCSNAVRYCFIGIPTRSSVTDVAHTLAIGPNEYFCEHFQFSCRPASSGLFVDLLFAFTVKKKRPLKRRLRCCDRSSHVRLTSVWCSSTNQQWVGWNFNYHRNGTRPNASNGMKRFSHRT